MLEAYKMTEIVVIVVYLDINHQLQFLKNKNLKNSSFNV